jgi:hypothetical protein
MGLLETGSIVGVNAMERAAMALESEARAPTEGGNCTATSGLASY